MQSHPKIQEKTNPHQTTCLQIQTMIARRVFSELSSRRSISILSRMMGSTRSLVLGIESSCDDSCAAIVSEDGQVLCSYQLSQEKQNQRNRGIIPAEAAKSHSKNIPLVVERALQSVPKEIDAVALTIGPGIAPCLGEGLLFAQRFCKENRKPLILVNHMEGHAMAATMQVRFVYLLLGVERCPLSESCLFSFGGKHRITSL